VLADRVARWRERGRGRDLAIGAFVVAAGVLVAFRLFNVYPWNAAVFDLRTYWATRFGIDFSAEHAGPAGAYLYSPAFAQLISPLTALPLPVFAAVWTAIGAALLYWMTGRHSIVFFILPAILITIVQGQLDLMFAAVAVVGMRYPAVWALPLLTKVTPGIGLVWFAVRREWRALAVALGATAAIAAVSFVIAPRAWFEWISILRTGSTFPEPVWTLDFVPLGVRLITAVAIVVWGARTDRPWTVATAATLALPVLWVNGLATLVAVIPLMRALGPTPASRFLAAARLPTSGRPQTTLGGDGR